MSTSYVQRSNLTLRMGNRRFTPLTNAFSKNVENHRHMVALFFLYYNFCWVHSTLRVTPAMESGISDHAGSLDEMCSLLTESAPATKRIDKGLTLRALGESELGLAIMRSSPRLATLATLLLCAAIATFGSAQTIQIPRGMRAVIIRIADDLSAVAGDRVDVLITAKEGARRVVLPNVKVVAADKNTHLVTFFLSPDDAQKATDAGGQGKFSLRLWKSN